MPYSHHSHSGQFCKHAKGTLEEVVQEAIIQGFEVYGLTEHVPRYRMEDLYPEEAGISQEDLAFQFDQFLTEAHRLKVLCADQITLLVGLETEYITQVDLDNLQVLLERYGDRIEYLVGSVHHANTVPIDFDAVTFQRALQSFTNEKNAADPPTSQMEDLLCSYFDAQYELLQRFHPEVIGHIDLCRLYNPSLRFADWPRAHEKLTRNIRYATSYGALFEVNAAALRKGWDAAYPGEDVARMIMEAGGRFTLSDDSHGPQAVGLNYAHMAAYLRRIGVDELWVLERSEVVNPGGRHTLPRKIGGKWWEHPFWTGAFV
ncbi:histidinol phosphate phosphatase H [Obba rivulosa]|uniref:Histidinol-phosphatase n=1 Tax=Obba rivulosa TaxID=1052685 RepID=A0A8E2AZ12_9APHY|nr:histidinol phosphate phosphatase H [Obba rivulosa]